MAGEGASDKILNCVVWVIIILGVCAFKFGVWFTAALLTNFGKLMLCGAILLVITTVIIFLCKKRNPCQEKEWQGVVPGRRWETKNRKLFLAIEAMIHRKGEAKWIS